MDAKVFVLVFDGFADWEPAHALAELRRSGGHEIVSVGFTTNEVTSMGGLHVRPDRAIADVNPDEVRLLILPGGDMWEKEDAYPRAELESTLAKLIAARRPIAAICGATIALARAGLLDDRRHTSNMPGYLDVNAPEYKGKRHYDASPAVRDRGIITATGLAPVDFARAIFTELALFSPADESVWYEMFRTGKVPEVVS